MRFEPTNEPEIAAKRIWPKGEYDFLILEATEKTSAAGNPMIELKVKITKHDGATRVVWDYILAKRPAKLLHCCTACGILDKYEAGVLADDDFVARTGKLKLGIQTSKYWPTKNVIRDYVVPNDVMKPVVVPLRRGGFDLPARKVGDG
jgi:hypothetical protein